MRHIQSVAVAAQEMLRAIAVVSNNLEAEITQSVFWCQLAH